MRALHQGGCMPYIKVLATRAARGGCLVCIHAGFLAALLATLSGRGSSLLRGTLRRRTRRTLHRAKELFSCQACHSICLLRKWHMLDQKVPRAVCNSECSVRNPHSIPILWPWPSHWPQPSHWRQQVNGHSQASAKPLASVKLQQSH
eukprot:1160210-Pelagomonas_calceolata.AAC.2